MEGFYLKFIYWRTKEDCLGCYLYSKQKKYFCKSVERSFFFVGLLASSILHSIYFCFFSFERELFYFRVYKFKNCFSFLLQYFKKCSDAYTCIIFVMEIESFFQKLKYIFGPEDTTAYYHQRKAASRKRNLNFKMNYFNAIFSAECFNIMF